MKKMIGFLIMLFSAAGLWAQIPQGTKVAVMDFTLTSTNESIDSRLITEMFQSALVNQKYFTVVERSQLEKIVGEQKLELSGLTESEQATKLGALLGAQKFFGGSISKMGSRYILIIKVIDTKTGAIESSEQVLLADLDSLLDVLPVMAERITKKLNGEVLPELKQYEVKKGPPSDTRENIAQTKQDLVAGIQARDFMNPLKLSNIQLLASPLSPEERVFYYKKYEMNSMVSLWNLIPLFALGSHFQGDSGSAWTINLLTAGGLALAWIGGGGFLTTVGNITALSAYIYGIFTPWFYAGYYNDSLRKALGYTSGMVYNKGFDINIPLIEAAF